MFLIGSVLKKLHIFLSAVFLSKSQAQISISIWSQKKPPVTLVATLFYFHPPDVPHFRYTAGSRGPAVSLDSMCDHHEKVFAAHYVANHLHSFSLPGIDCTALCTTDSLLCSQDSDYLVTEILFIFTLDDFNGLLQSLPNKTKEWNQKTIVSKLSDLEYTHFSITVCILFCNNSFVKRSIGLFTLHGTGTGTGSNGS